MGQQLNQVISLGIRIIYFISEVEISSKQSTLYLTNEKNFEAEFYLRIILQNI